MLERQVVRRALSLTCPKTERMMPVSTPMMAMTISISIKVKPFVVFIIAKHMGAHIMRPYRKTNNLSNYGRGDYLS
jgi:hypothetical protein